MSTDKETDIETCRRSSRTVKRKEDPLFIYDSSQSSQPAVKKLSKATLKKKKQKEMRRLPEVLIYDNGDDSWSTTPGGHNAQFYTEKQREWREAILEDLHRKFRDGLVNTVPELVDTEEHPQVRLKSEDDNSWKVTVKFFETTGVVVIQGKDYQDWCINTFPTLKSKMTCPLTVTRIEGGSREKLNVVSNSERVSRNTQDMILPNGHIVAEKLKVQMSGKNQDREKVCEALDPEKSETLEPEKSQVSENIVAAQVPEKSQDQASEHLNLPNGHIAVENLHVQIPEQTQQLPKEEDLEDSVISQLFREIERLNGELATKKAELKVSSTNLKSADGEIVNLQKIIADMKKSTEKQKRELRKIQNSKDNIAKEKLCIKHELEQAGKLIDDLRKFNKNIGAAHPVHPVDTTVTWAKKLAEVGHEARGTKPARKATSPHRGPALEQKEKSASNKQDVTKQASKNQREERNKDKQVPETKKQDHVKGRKYAEKSDLLLVGDYVLKGISSALDIDCTAYVNPSIDALKMNERLTHQIEDRKYILIQCGSNNLKEELRKSIPALGGMIDTAVKSSKGHVMINALPGHLHDEKHNDLTRRINTFLKHRCDRSDRLHFVNCNPSLEAKHYAPNGLHFNERGRQMYATHLGNMYENIRNFAIPPRMTSA